MNSAEVLDLVNEIEEKFPVTEWTAAGIKIWPLARSGLWWNLNDVYMRTRDDRNAHRPVRRRARRLAALPAGVAGHVGMRIRDWKHDVRRVGSAEAVFLGDNVSRVLLEGEWYDRICEPMIEELERRSWSSLHLEPHYVHRAPRHDRSLLIQPRLDARWIRSRLRPAQRLPGVDVPGHDLVDNLVAGIGVDPGLLGRTFLQRQAWAVRVLADWYRRVLERTRARLGFVVDAGWAQMAFNLACREHGIPSIELQHGVQGKLNAAYGRWRQVPHDGYALLPRIFWVWSSQEASAIEEWSRPVREWHRPVIGGNPWLNVWLRDDAEVARPYDRAVQAIRSRDPESVHVLVTLAYSLTSERDLAPIREAIEKAPSTWRWWVRLHPAMSNTDRARARKVLPVDGQRVLLDLPSELPLYALLRNAELHLTINSTSVVEAEAFGVPSVATSPEATDLFEDQATRGWLTIASGGREVVAALIDQQERANSLPRADRIWAATSDALDEILAWTSS